MTNYRIDVIGFFENHLAFPWDILGYGVPKAGQVHSYVCSILAPHSHLIERPLLEANPSLREVGRLARALNDASNAGTLPQIQGAPPFVTSDIFKHCSDLYERRASERESVAQEVLNCLRRFEHYKKFVTTRLDYLWRQDLISIPRQYLVVVDPPEKRSPHNRIY